MYISQKNPSNSSYLQNQQYKAFEGFSSVKIASVIQLNF